MSFLPKKKPSAFVDSILKRFKKQKLTPDQAGRLGDAYYKEISDNLSNPDLLPAFIKKNRNGEIESVHYLDFEIDNEDS